ncbi:MAG: hypothetical protein HRK26_04045 [Rickettsiaceae bacterium H1]|nr:hypothetical protein [Rickettsiaceae bacterium H1]
MQQVALKQITSVIVYSAIKRPKMFCHPKTRDIGFDPVKSDLSKENYLLSQNVRTHCVTTVPDTGEFDVLQHKYIKNYFQYRKLKIV